MKQLAIFTLVFLLMFSCNVNTVSDETKMDTTGLVKSDSAENKIDTIKVKNWIINSIEKTLNGGIAEFENGLKTILSKDYYEYKQDAINIEYDTGDVVINRELFKKKWQDRYDVKYVGNGGFLVSAQDNGKIKVSTCFLIKQISKDLLLFKVVIDDIDNKVKYNRDMKVKVIDGNKYLIYDIIEYN